MSTMNLELLNGLELKDKFGNVYRVLLADLSKTPIWARMARHVKTTHVHDDVEFKGEGQTFWIVSTRSVLEADGHEYRSNTVLVEELKPVFTEFEPIWSKFIEELNQTLGDQNAN